MYLLLKYFRLVPHWFFNNVSKQVVITASNHASVYIRVNTYLYGTTSWYSFTASQQYSVYNAENKLDTGHKSTALRVILFRCIKASTCIGVTNVLIQMQITYSLHVNWYTHRGFIMPTSLLNTLHFIFHVKCFYNLYSILSVLCTLNVLFKEKYSL
jgi:hypothetical protein